MPGTTSAAGSGREGSLRGSRRAARERALSLLYEAEAKDVGADALLLELPVAPDPYAADLVRGVSERRTEIDALIARMSRDWPLQRMPAIDRNLLRLAVYELLGRTEVPVGVVIDEAVELAKLYSTDDSGRFVNGVLSAVAGEVR